MIKIILRILFLLNFRILFGQTLNNNQDLINKIKFNASKDIIQSKIYGCWLAVKKTSNIGVEKSLSSYNVNYCFLSDSILYIGNDIKTKKITAKYYYDDVNNEIRINYLIPLIPGKGSVPDAFLDSLIKKQIIKPIKYSILEINKLDDNELILIEHLPHDEKHFEYNLIYYKKG